jgi:hypothetical protein
VDNTLEPIVDDATIREPPSRLGARHLVVAALVGALVGGGATTALLAPMIDEARDDCVVWALAVGAEAHARSSRSPSEHSAAAWADRIRAADNFVGVDRTVARPEGCR